MTSLYFHVLIWAWDQLKTFCHLYCQVLYPNEGLSDCQAYCWARLRGNFASFWRASRSLSVVLNEAE